MTQIVFVNIIEVCFLMIYVVLTITCRHEFTDVMSFVRAWLLILGYFLVYVNWGNYFVKEFVELVAYCETYLAEDDEPSDTNTSQEPLKEDNKDETYSNS